MANLKTLNPKTGQLHDEGEGGSGFLVNMDDPEAQKFVKRMRGKNWTEPVAPEPVKVEEPVKEVVELTPAEKRAITMAAKKAE